MNSVKLLGGVVAALAVSGCNQGQPRIWRVTYDTSPFVFVSDSNCYISKRLPTTQTQQRNYRRDSNWVIWDGVVDMTGSQKQFLDIGSPEFRLGESPRVKVEDVIEGDAATRQFSATRETLKQGPEERGRTAVERRTGEVIVAWDNYNAGATGNLTIKSTYVCQDRGSMMSERCPTAGETPADDAANCQVSVPFVARRIDVNQNTNYGNTGIDNQ